MIKLKGGTASAMSAENPVLADRQPGFARTDNGGILKIGDGVTPWNDLPAISEGGIIGDFVEISQGGTSATNRVDAIDNLLVLNNNTFPSEDTTTAWAEMGNFIMYVSSAPDTIDLPSTYGTLIQLVGKTGVTSIQQIWLRQAYGYMYHRAGNSIGWNGDASVSGADAWFMSLDSKNPENPFYGSGGHNEISPAMSTWAEVGGGALSFPYSSNTGYLRITIPEIATQDGLNSMIALTLDIASYTRNFVGSYYLGGEIYQSDSSTTKWAGESVKFVGTENTQISNLPVEFGIDDNGRLCIQLGTETTPWGYGCAVIRDVKAYYNNFASDDWNQGWKVEITTSPLAASEGSNYYSKNIISTVVQYNEDLDTTLKSNLLVPCDSANNVSLYNVIGGSFAYVHQIFYNNDNSITSRRYQIAHNYSSNMMATRTMQSSGDWDKWEAIITTDWIQFSTGADLNNFLTVGRWQCNSSTLCSSLLNCPLSSSVFTLEISQVGSWVSQKITKFSDGVIYYRYWDNSKWSAWNNSFTTDSIIPLENGGLGFNASSIPDNAIIRKGAGVDYIYYTATSPGAYYATSSNGQAVFGTLPLAQGGTGATSAVNARKNLKILTMTESAYNSLQSKDANTIYICY